MLISEHFDMYNVSSEKSDTRFCLLDLYIGLQVTRSFAIFEAFFFSIFEFTCGHVMGK